MFRENTDHEQEMLFSPLKDLSGRVQKKLENHWSTHFYEHVFTQIDERKFERLYHDGYSRLNKPANELVSLEIIKHLLGMSDKELEHAYVFDFRVRNALGKETLGDNICEKTLTNFRCRLMEYEEETGQDLLHEVFENHRTYFQREFEIDASTQRMDSTFIEANIKQLSRVDLLAKVLHNFLCDLPEEIVQELPAGMDEFADTENLELSYHLEPDEIPAEMETLAEHIVWLVERFRGEAEYAELESFAHLQRVLEEQCYRIPEFEDDTDNLEPDDRGHPGDESPGWQPLQTYTSPSESTATAGDESDSESGERDAEERHDHVGLEESDEIGSESLQNPHDDEATYRSKNAEDYFGYKSNIAETCNGENPFRLITAVQVDTNNTDDGDLLGEDARNLAEETGLCDLLVDGGYTHKEVEKCCRDQEITQHFTGITGQRPAAEKMSLAAPEWDGTRMVACPAGHEPFEQNHYETGRISGKMDKKFCDGCQYQENCFVEEQQEHYSYGFRKRRVEVAQRRQRLDDPAEQEFLNLRAGVESLMNEMYHKDGEKTEFTGKIKVKNASIAKAIGRNLKRASGFLESEAKQEKSAG
ncbi:transposase [Halonotius pteroides]|uniref:DDE transposase n=1 Tax=Halonotius pteroides TaxID=268735 RepID=A0A3A6Q2Q4_9EURY|nr:transposase [Halonotius pteroides]RJX48199.1 DDE transposase [Halonotius pteroides]